MARKRKTRKHHSRRRHSRSGIGAIGSTATQAVGIIAGAAIGKIAASKLLPNVDDKIKNAAVLAIGAFVAPKLIKSDLGKALGNGMIAAGGVGLLGSFLPALAGIEDTIEFPVQVSGTDDNFSVIAGSDSVMAGSDSVMAGDAFSVIAGADEDYY